MPQNTYGIQLPNFQFKNHKQFRQWYNEQKRKVISYRKQIRIKYAQNYKRKHFCQSCGQKDFRVLTFHHKNAKDKKFSLCESRGYSLTLIKQQISKCDILCQNCHNALHYKQHLQKFNAKLLALPKLTGISGSRKYGRTVKQQRKLNKQRIFIKSKQLIIQTKRNSSCSKCGKTGQEYLCFHHRDTSQKEDNIGAIANRKSSVKHVKQQIAKCDIMCHNCHTIHHYNDMQQQTGQNQYT